MKSGWAEADERYCVGLFQLSKCSHCIFYVTRSVQNSFLESVLKQQVWFFPHGTGPMFLYCQYWFGQRRCPPALPQLMSPVCSFWSFPEVSHASGSIVFPFMSSLQTSRYHREAVWCRRPARYTAGGVCLGLAMFHSADMTEPVQVLQRQESRLADPVGVHLNEDIRFNMEVQASPGTEDEGFKATERPVNRRFVLLAQTHTSTQFEVQFNWSFLVLLFFCIPFIWG